MTFRNSTPSDDGQGDGIRIEHWKKLKTDLDMKRKATATISFLLVISMVAVAVIGFSQPVKAGSSFQDDEMKFDKVTKRVDRDGDGYVSSFKVKFSADTLIRDAARPDLKKDISKNKIFNTPGHPKFVLFGIVPQGNKWKQVLLGIKEVSQRTNSNTVEMTVELLDKKFQRPPQGNSLVENKGMEGLALTYAESDSSPDSFVTKDVNTIKAVVEGTFGTGKVVGGIVLVATGAGAGQGVKLIKSSKSNFISVGKSIKKSWNSDDIVQTDVKPLKKPLKLEEPSEDRTKQLKVTSNVNGATVKIDGKNVGTTPWTGKYPVDYTKRNGPATVQVSGDGYVSDTRSVKIGSQGQQTERFSLKKNKKPLVVNATPSNASIYIDGSYAGNPPVKREMWVKKSVDVWINASGYINKQFEGVSPPRTIDWDLLEPDELSPGDPGSIGGIGSIGTIRQIPDFDFSAINLRGIFWANFSYAPKDISTGDTVSFDGTLSTVIAGNITKYGWKFGDGSTATGPRSSYTYSSSGKYTVNLTITTGSGNTTSTEKTLTVKNVPPVARFIASSLSVVEGQSVTFDATSSNDPENATVRYAWDFDGDGSTDTTGQRVTHAYATSGNYTVELTVTDGASQSDTVTKNVRVRRPNTAPRPKITLSKPSPAPNETVKLDASSSSDPDGSIKVYNWELGDGTQASGKVVSHSYSHNGTYKVRLLVADSRGKIATTTKIIKVGSGTPPTRQAQTTAEENAGGQQSQKQNQSKADGGGSTGMPGFTAIAGVIGVLVSALVMRMRATS